LQTQSTITAAALVLRAKEEMVGDVAICCHIHRNHDGMIGEPEGSLALDTRNKLAVARSHWPSKGSKLLLLEGWTARVRQLPDGRRQLVSFGLPGDLLGYCQFDGARASSTMAAVTEVTICHLPDPALSPALTRAFAISRAVDEAYLIAQVTRLGRLNAHERLIDFLLELYERLEPCGLAEAGRFLIPLTQEAIADALGLTPVHLNRTLQEARRNGELTWTGREVTLHDPNAAAVAVGHTRPRVCAFPASSGA
jgi:CRP-like cAMP-binding protein